MTTKPRDTAYYAIPDPEDPAKMTYWRRNGANIEPWPARAKYGPFLLRSHVPKGPDRTAMVRRWYHDVRQPWQEAIFAAIRNDTGEAQKAFAMLTTRCHVCGRELTDPTSQYIGVGPDCRGDR